MVCCRNDKQKVSNPIPSWQKEYSNLKSGDSVAFSFDIVPMVNSQLIYNWEVSITVDDYTNGKTESGDIT